MPQSIFRITDVVAKLDSPRIFTLFKECTPRILVVTDNLNYTPGSDFGLTEFVNTLRASTIHSMTPEVRTAVHNPSVAAVLSYNAATQHISNFKFDDSTHGILKSRYDVVFLLGFDGEGSPRVVPAPGLAAITAFMQAGGGLFATGDHEDLGFALSGEIPRVRSMRFWRDSDTPNIGNTTRLSTNLPGTNDSYEFDDQADAFPQRLYVNYRSNAGGIGFAHPLLQVPASSRAIEVFPDHPHEGECHIPTDLTTKLPGTATDEWPVATGGGAHVSPEMVALTMSHGDSFPGKQALVPRSFMAICAYDGQTAGVGRVVTDATWHHFVNVNIVGTGAPGRLGLTGTNLADVKQYYKNLATWLMPQNVRKCLRYPYLLQELVRFPLFEELRAPRLEVATGTQLLEVGKQIEAALVTRSTTAEVRELIDDVLEEGMGKAAVDRITAMGGQVGRISLGDAGQAALGALTIGLIEKMRDVVDKTEIDPHAVFEPLAKEAPKLGVRRFVEEARKELRLLDDIFSAC